MARIYLAELDAYVPGSGVVTFYFSTQGYVTKPTDTPANQYYDGRIEQPGNVQRSMFDGGRTFGQSRIGFGELILVNTDGALDDMIDYGFDGRAITIKRGDVEESDGGVPTWTTVLRGTMEQPEFSWGKVTIRVRDRQFELDKPIQITRYGGTNVLPAGLDGVAGDLKGKPRPRIYGSVYNIAPPKVNTSLWVYELSASLVDSLPAVYDKGAALTPGTARRLALMGAAAAPKTFTVVAATDIVTTSTAHGYLTGDPVTVSSTTTLPAPLLASTYYYARFLSTTTLTLHTSAAGAAANTGLVDLTTTGSGTHTIDNNSTIATRYDWCFDAAGSYIRLTTEAGQITCDVIQGATAADRTAAQIMKRMLLDAGISLGDISAADVTALDTACSYEVGFYAPHDSDVSFIAALDAVANSIGAWYGQDRLGVFQMGRVMAPSGTSAETLTELEILRIDRVASSDQGRGVPAYRVNLEYQRYEATQSAADLVTGGTLTDARRAALREQYRRTSAQDLTIQTKHLLAPEITFQTNLIASANADSEASRRLGMYKVRRDRYEVRVALTPALLASLDLGVVVTVFFPRFDCDSGKQFLLIGLRIDLYGGLLDLTLWG